MIARLLRLPAVLLMLAITVAGLVQTRFPLALGVPSFTAGLVAGVALLAIALAIAGSALAVMKRHRTTVEPGQRPSRLVTANVFAFTRNPIYLAMVLIVLALAILADAIWFALGAVVLFVVLDRVVIRAEERIVEDVFGEEYVAYKRRVRRWL